MVDALRAGDWKGAAAQLWTGIQAEFTKGSAAVKSIWGKTTEWLSAQWSKMFGLIAAAMPALQIAGGILAAAAAFYVLGTAAGIAGAAFSAVMSIIGPFVGAVVGAITFVVGAVFTAIGVVGSLVSAFADVVIGIGAFFEAITQIVEGVKSLRELFGMLTHAITTVINTALTMGSAVASAVTQVASAGASAVALLATEALTTVFGVLGEIVVGVGGAIAGIIATAGAALIPLAALAAVVAAGAALVYVAWEAVSAAVSAVFSGIVVVAKDAAGSVASAFLAIPSVFMRIVSSVSEAFHSLVSMVHFGGIISEAQSAVGSIATTFGTLRTYLLGIWPNIQSDSISAFKGIKDALSSGDWATAAQIAWTYIQLEFARGVAALRPIWLDVKEYALTAWYDLVAGVQSAWSYIQEFVTWDNVKAVTQDLLTWFRSAVGRRLDLVRIGLGKRDELRCKDRQPGG